MVCLPVKLVTYTVEGSSHVVRTHGEQEQIRYRLLVLMRPRIDQQWLSKDRREESGRDRQGSSKVLALSVGTLK